MQPHRLHRKWAWGETSPSKRVFRSSMSSERMALDRRFRQRGHRRVERRVDFVGRGMSTMGGEVFHDGYPLDRRLHTVFRKVFVQVLNQSCNDYNFISDAKIRLSSENASGSRNFFGTERPGKETEDFPQDGTTRFPFFIRRGGYRFRAAETCGRRRRPAISGKRNRQPESGTRKRGRGSSGTFRF